MRPTRTSDTVPPIRCRKGAGAILCGPRPPSTRDLEIVEQFGAWLGGDRTVWNDDFVEVSHEREVDDA